MDAELVCQLTINWRQAGPCRKPLASLAQTRSFQLGVGAKAELRGVSYRVRTRRGNHPTYFRTEWGQVQGDRGIIVNLDRLVGPMHKMTGMSHSDIEAQQRALLSQALEMILGQLAHPTSTDNLASSVGYSRSHFRHLFAAEYGQGPARFARRLRLERAAGHLSMTESSVHDIAQQAGYESPEAFTKAFREHFGMTPTDFRARNSGERRLMPGYICESSRDSARLPVEVGIVGHDSQVTTFVFEDLSLRTRLYPDRTN